MRIKIKAPECDYSIYRKQNLYIKQEPIIARCQTVLRTKGQLAQSPPTWISLKLRCGILLPVTLRAAADLDSLPCDAKNSSLTSEMAWLSHIVCITTADRMHGISFRFS